MKNIEKYFNMSPFEVKNELIEVAQKSAKKNNRKFFNAGRGNPNFLNTTVRSCFILFSEFAIKMADEKHIKDDIGFRPSRVKISEKLDSFIADNLKRKGGALLKESIEYARENFVKNYDDFVFELADAALGDFYPNPPRIFPHVEKIVRSYIKNVLFFPEEYVSHFDLFATEGATAAMIYLFNSLKFNRILKEGDTIAIITPIFSPYLEIPPLEEYHFEEILVKGDPNADWQLPDEELEKLKNPKIKALYMVNPTNPTSVAMSDKCIKKIANIVKNERKDLIVITDVVYAPFVREFHSILTEIPENVICVYSYSKFFGVTGWRLGVIMLHDDNVIDKMLQNLSEKENEKIHDRYKTLVPDPNKMKFIDRLEADSREEALAHTGGLSCPQQCIMAFFSLFSLLDKKKKYKQDIHEILKKRIEYLYSNLGLKAPEEKGHTYYYALLDFSKIAEKKYSKEFAEDLKKNHLLLEFLFRLAEKYSVICLPGEGFAGPKWSLRVSLANLDDDAYIVVGKALNDLLENYHEEWSKKKS